MTHHRKDAEDWLADAEQAAADAGDLPADYLDAITKALLALTHAVLADPPNRCERCGIERQVQHEDWCNVGKATRTVTVVMRSNPECQAGKHANCDGECWDLATDKLVPCPCTCHMPAHPSEGGS